MKEGFCGLAWKYLVYIHLNVSIVTVTVLGIGPSDCDDVILFPGPQSTALNIYLPGNFSNLGELAHIVILGQVT